MGIYNVEWRVLERSSFLRVRWGFQKVSPKLEAEPWALGSEPCHSKLSPLDFSQLLGLVAFCVVKNLFDRYIFSLIKVNSKICFPWAEWESNNKKESVSLTLRNLKEFCNWELDLDISEENDCDEHLPIGQIREWIWMNGNIEWRCGIQKPQLKLESQQACRGISQAPAMHLQSRWIGRDVHLHLQREDVAYFTTQPEEEKFSRGTTAQAIRD